jgi:hypothetical protein
MDSTDRPVFVEAPDPQGAIRTAPRHLELEDDPEDASIERVSKNLYSVNGDGRWALVYNLEKIPVATEVPHAS